MLQLTRDIGGVMHIQVRVSSQPPAAFRIQVRKLYSLMSAIAVTLLLLLGGTFLFFREIEINRQLTDRLLELETTMSLQTAIRRNFLKPELKNPVPQETAEQAQVKASVVTPTPASVIRPAPSIVTAHLGELGINCTEESLCDAHVHLTPSSPGLAEGSLLLVLEAEVVRIGGADPNAPTRRQYVAYPDFTVLEDLQNESVQKLEKKPFRFSRALPINVEFKVATSQKPVAIHFYLYDSKNNLIYSDRKAVESD